MLPLIGNGPTFFADILQAKRKLSFESAELPKFSNFQIFSEFVLFQDYMQLKSISRVVRPRHITREPPSRREACFTNSAIDSRSRAFMISEFDIDQAPQKIRLCDDTIPLPYEFSELALVALGMKGQVQLYRSCTHRPAAYNLKKSLYSSLDIPVSLDTHATMLDVVEKAIKLTEIVTPFFETIDMISLHEEEISCLDVVSNLPEIGSLRIVANRNNRPRIRTVLMTKATKQSDSTSSANWKTILNSLQSKSILIEQELKSFLQNDTSIEEETFIDTSDSAGNLAIFSEYLSGISIYKENSIQFRKTILASQLLYSTPQFPFITVKKCLEYACKEFCMVDQFELTIIALKVRKRIITSNYRQYLRRSSQTLNPNNVLKTKTMDVLGNFLKKFHIKLSTAARVNNSVSRSPPSVTPTDQQQNIVRSVYRNTTFTPDAPHSSLMTPKISEPVRDMVTRYLKSPLLSPVLSPDVKKIGISLTVLMSDCLITRQSFLISILKNKCDVTCIDCSLDLGIDFILDGITAVSLLPAKVLRDRLSLKNNIRILTKNVFKFSKIWLVVLEDEIKLRPSEVVPFLSSIANFPCQIFVRYSKVDDIDRVFRSVCCDCMSFASNKSIPKVRYHDRSFFDFISNPIFAAQCACLSAFPTINFYIAAEILSKYRLYEVGGLTIPELISLVCLIPQNSIERFYCLLQCNLGTFVSESDSIDVVLQSRLLSSGDDDFSSKKLRKLGYETNNVVNGQSKLRWRKV